MLNIDKIIDEHNDTILKDRIDYYRTIDNIDTAEGTISAVSTLPEGTIMSTVELKVTVVGRDCDDLGHPIDFD